MGIIFDAPALRLERSKEGEGDFHGDIPMKRTDDG